STQHQQQQDPVEQQENAGQNYQQLLQQREEENRQEVERLTAEIRDLKLQLLRLTSNEETHTRLRSFPAKFFPSLRLFSTEVNNTAPSISNSNCDFVVNQARENNLFERQRAGSLRSTVSPLSLSNPT
ncbi:hypothetical protein Trydic_g5719, partial [Trypoxylus dichotomus]